MNFALGQFIVQTFSERFFKEGRDGEEFTSWLIRTVPLELSEKQKLEQRQCPEIAAAQLLMRLVRTNRLKDLRECGLYENTDKKFTDDEIMQTIGLTSRVRQILSKSWVVLEVMQHIGVNLPTGITFESP
jgi:hypothetical protein